MTLANTTGSGPDLALIHGWGLGSWVWQPLLGRLSQDRRVHLVDLPGYGCSPDGGSGDCAVADFSATAQSLLERLPERVVVCGWSLGGMLALRAAALAPERVSGLVLVGSTPCFVQRRDWLPAQPPALLDGFSAGIEVQPVQALQRFASLLGQGDACARTITRTLLAGLRQVRSPHPDTLKRGLAWLREVDLRPLLPAVSTRSLLIHGDRDTLNPLAAATFLREQLADARLEVFANAGHAPFLADPERFARRLDSFCHVSATH